MAGEPLPDKPVPLSAAHDLSTFDCGAPPLNDYLRKHAYVNHQSNAARTYVSARENRVVGYYTLAAGAVRREETTSRVAKGLARHPVPIILLARLAIDLREQGKGIGAALFEGCAAPRRAGGRCNSLPCSARARQRRIGQSILRALRLRSVPHRSIAPLLAAEGHKG